MKDTYMIDNRKVEDIEEEIRKLAESYVPEWKFTPSNPDIGAVIAMLFARQQYENVKRYNDIIPRIHCEYLNMLGITRKPMNPAKAVVVFEMMPEQEDVIIERGTRLIAETDDDEGRILLATCNRFLATGANLKNVFVASKNENYVAKVYDEEQDWNPIIFKASHLPHAYTRELHLYHHSVFGVTDQEITLELQGNLNWKEALRKEEYELLYRTEQGYEPLSVIAAGESQIVVSMDKPALLIQEDPDEEIGEYEIMIRQIAPQAVDIVIDHMGIVTEQGLTPVEYVRTGAAQQHANDFLMFDESMNLYAECYVGMDSCFARTNSWITLEFDLNFEPIMVGERPIPEEQLKIIKRKKKYEAREVVLDVFAQRVSVEYYSEEGWKKIDDLTNMEGVFVPSNENDHKFFSFECPDDWMPVDLEGYSGRALRFVLVKADNCYYQPSLHYIPRIRNMKVAYNYQDRPQMPDAYMIVDEQHQVREAWNDKTLTVFNSEIQDEDALVLGLSKAPKGGPVSIYFKMKEEQDFSGADLSFEYSTKKGFKPLSVMDSTGGGQYSGRIMFLPPSDFDEMVYAGQKACYIRIVDRNQSIRALPRRRPVVEKIYLNAMEAENLHTLEEEEFHVELPEAHMSFPLGSVNIYDADVWVNETKLYSERDMLSLAHDHPEQYRIIYDGYQHIQSFYSLWTEVEDLRNTKERKVYQLDRQKGNLLFGDGKNTDIPRTVDDVAFMVRLRICNGKLGNILPHSILGFFDTVTGVVSVDNPYMGYGGTDLESVKQTILRGQHQMNSNHRLITRQDYEREILSYSESIRDVKCLVERDGKLRILLLMCDYDQGPESFLMMRNRLVRHLCDCSEYMIQPEDIVIQRPIFVEVSVELWLDMQENMDVFAVQNEIQTCMNKYLDPITGRNGQGFHIGEFPTEKQILMQLSFQGITSRVRNVVLNAKYTDENGMHETRLSDLAQIEQAEIMNGTHKVHFI